MELPGTLVFDYPTITAIAGFVSPLLAPAAGSAVSAGSGDAAFLSALLDTHALDASGFAALAAPTSSTVTVALAAVVTRQPAGIMAGGVPSRRALCLLFCRAAHACLNPTQHPLLVSPPQP